MMRLLTLLALLAVILQCEAFSSTGVTHLEPVNGVRFSFGPESEATKRKREDALQPFPSTLDLSFSIFGTDFSFNLEIYPEVTRGGKITFHGEHDEILVQRPLKSVVYRSKNPGELVNVVLGEEGLFHALFLHEDELYVVNPLFMHQQELDSKTKRDLELAGGLVAYKESDTLNDGKLCGAVSPPINGKSANTITLETPERIARKLLTVDRWTNCFPRDDITRRFEVGFYVDRGFYAALATSVEQAISIIISSANIIYQTQVNVVLAAGNVIVKTAANEDIFNQGPAPCARNISTVLTDFWKWRSGVVDPTAGVYHLLTNCYPPPGTVGIAYLGMLCEKNLGVGVTTFTPDAWKTFAHEVGHNFGAEHTFQNGQGTTGGIMDYGDGTLNGEYQFNSQYNKNQVCAEITQSMGLAGSQIVERCWRSLNPTCGNGVVDPGEQCDDSSSCCQNCQFTIGSTCSGDGPCCSGCVAAPSTTNCGTEGYCLNGKCAVSQCFYYPAVEFCTDRSSDPCQETCQYQNDGVCRKLNLYGLTGGTLQDGAICSQTPLSTCLSGTCTPSYSWKVGDWGSCICPSGYRERSVTCVDSNGSAVNQAYCGQITPPASTESCSCSSQCNPNPCQNGGVCTDIENSFICACVSPYFGTTCQYSTNQNYCDSSPCQNGGTCVNGLYSYSCNCPPSYSGTDCQNRVCSCNIMGSVTDLCDSTGQCQCKYGFTGANCDQCLPGFVGGVCHECACNPQGSTSIACDSFNFQCPCKYGWAGLRCSYCDSKHTGANCDTTYASKKTNYVPIIYGTVGGVAALGIAGAAFYFWRKKRNPFSNLGSSGTVLSPGDTQLVVTTKP